MKTNQPDTLKELRAQISDLENQKAIREQAFRNSAKAFGESLKPENIMLSLTGKLIECWMDKKEEEETQETRFKDRLIGVARKFAGGAVERGIDLVLKKIFS